MKKRVKLLSSITMALVAGTLAISASAAATHNYKGDINRDDKVDLSDLVCLKKHFAGLSYIPEGNIKYADMDGNGKLNVIDFMCLKKAVLSKDAPKEIETAAEETTTAVTTAATTKATTAATTKATTAATTAATTKATTAATTAATTKATTAATTAATTKATTAATTAATTKATTAATTTATTKATTAATTTTSTTKATTAATTTTTTTAATTTTTTSTTKATTTTTTTTTSAAATTTTTTTVTEATTPSKTYPAKVGNGVNSIAPESADRAFIILGGANNDCKYDSTTNINDFVPGSVQMPEITGDGDYKASFYVYDEGIIDKTGGTFISNTYLRIIKAGTWETYTTDEKPDLKITVTKATADGVQRDLSGLTQDSNEASVDISSLLGSVNNFEIEFTVEGFNSTGSSGSTTPETPSSGSTRTVTIASDKTYASSDMNNWSLSDVIGSGETIENIVIRISPVSGNDTIGGINFNLRTPDYARINQNIQTTVSDAAYTFSLADVLDESGKEKLSTVTGSDEIILQSYWLQNGNIKIDSIEVTLKS